MKAGRLFAVMMVVGAMGMLAWAGPAAAAGPITGTVTNQSAQPLDGVEVCAVVFAPYSENCASTDAAGEYSIPGTGPGYKVHFYDPNGVAPSYAPQWFPGVPHPEEGQAVTEAEIEAGVDAVMTRGAEVAGTVLANNTGAPLAGVRICTDPESRPVGEFPVCDETGADGRFALSDLGLGAIRIDFEPGESLNYQPTSFTTPPLSAGSGIELTARLVRGVEFEGTLTDATTGLPVAEFGGPGRTPTACALEGFTEERVKCAPVGPDGKYVIAGLPAGGYELVFGADTKEDGVDLHPDGFVRQYYEEGLLLIGEDGSVFNDLDATLDRGEEIWPGEEEAPSELAGEEVSDGGTTGGGTTETFNSSPNQAGGATAPPRPAPFAIGTPNRTVLPKYTCRKGFHRVATGGQSRCVKIKKKPKKHRPKKHHAKKAVHR